MVVYIFFCWKWLFACITEEVKCSLYYKYKKTIMSCQNNLSKKKKWVSSLPSDTVSFFYSNLLLCGLMLTSFEFLTKFSIIRSSKTLVTIRKSKPT